MRKFRSTGHLSNQLDTRSPTLVNAMRQAYKNIMYTVVNSAAYDEENLQTGLALMTQMFVIIDVIVTVVYLTGRGESNLPYPIVYSSYWLGPPKLMGAP